MMPRMRLLSPGDVLSLWLVDESCWPGDTDAKTRNAIAMRFDMKTPFYHGQVEDHRCGAAKGDYDGDSYPCEMQPSHFLTRHNCRSQSKIQERTVESFSELPLRKLQGDNAIQPRIAGL